MRQPVSDSDDSGNGGFQKIVDGFLLQPRLPFAQVLTAEKINRIFRKHGGLFGEHGIYNTAIVLWAFLGQVLCHGKAAACQMAVANIISFNVGVEIGQGLALTGILIGLSYWRTRAGFLRHAFATNAAVMAGGFLLMGYQLSGYFLATS